MTVGVAEQLRLLAVSFLAGGILSLQYDFVRFVRMLLGVPYGAVRVPKARAVKLPLLGVGREPKKHGVSLSVAVFLGDLLFAVSAAIVMLLVFFNYNSGRVRLFAFPSAGAGFLLCHKTVGALMLRVFGLIRFALGVFFRYLFSLLRLPFRAVLIPLLRVTLGAAGRALLLGVRRIATAVQTKKAIYDVLCGSFGADREWKNAPVRFNRENAKAKRHVASD